MSLALEGIRVVDMTTGQQGPVATQYLGDLGADVIKVEDPVRGDSNRGLERVFGTSATLPQGRWVLMEALNRNKRGVAVDLKQPAGREIIYKLVMKADVFAQNYRPGAAARLGVDYETLAKLNPKLVYASATCFGRKGPDGGRAGNDLLASARSGFLFQIGEPGSPAPVADTLADRIGGILFAYSLVVALLVRERTGIGQEVNASLLGSMIHLQGFNLAMTLLKGAALPNPGRKRAARPLWNLYRCKDGVWLTISHVRQPEKYWPLLCRAMGRADLITDPRFETAVQREQNSEQLVAILDAIFTNRTYAEWAEILREKMGDFFFDKAKHISELMSDPQVIENEYIVDFNHPTLGPIKMEGIAAQLSKTPGSIRRPSPELGEHTEEVLLELGYDWEQVAALKDRKVIR